MSVRPAKTQTSLGIRTVWSESSLSAWRKFGPLATVPTESTAKTLIRLGGCPGWSESSLGAHSLCWFCHVAAHFLFKHLLLTISWRYENDYLCLWLILKCSFAKFSYSVLFIWLFSLFFEIKMAHEWIPYLTQSMTKLTKWHVRPAKPQISLCICPVWSVFAVHSVGS